MSKLQAFNIALRGLMELGIILALGYWGYTFGNSMMGKIIWCIGTPLMGFGFWSLVDFHQFGKNSETLRLLQELVVSGIAALALYSTGMHILGWLIVGISILHHVLVYSLGERLLKNKK